MSKILEMYRNWRKEDGDSTEKGYQVDTIAIVPKSRLTECEENPDDIAILYYVSSIQDLLDLMKPGNGSDFIVDEVLEFYKK